MLMYAVHHGETWVYTQEDRDEAIEAAELSADQVGGTWTVTVYDPSTNTMYDTIYVVTTDRYDV